MRSLQVLTPSRKCMFNCPFCISKSHEHGNQFPNNYEHNHDLWVRNYIEVITSNPDLSYVVITGTNEPMQSPDCVLDITMITKEYRPDIQVEIQTRYYPVSPIYEVLDVVAYSISELGALKRIKPHGKKNRFVILLTKSFEQQSLDDIIKMIPKEVTEVTFKVLHDSKGYNHDMDEWILNNGMSEEGKQLLEYQVSKYIGPLSIRYDATCMECENRYMIFREDGNVYQNWDEKVKKLV